MPSRLGSSSQFIKHAVGCSTRRLFQATFRLRRCRACIRVEAIQERAGRLDPLGDRAQQQLGWIFVGLGRSSIMPSCAPRASTRPRSSRDVVVRSHGPTRPSTVWRVCAVSDRFGGRMTADDDITGMLVAASGGDADAARRLAGLVYDELRRRAEALMRRESPGHTVQATILVHDAYLKLIHQERAGWTDRNHFFAVAAQTMRRLLVDHARARQRDKRGGGRVKVSLDERLGLSSHADADVLAVDQALTRLEALDPQQARIVELRFFGGLTVAEVAQQLEISKRAVEAEWTMIAAWLRRELLAD